MDGLYICSARALTRSYRLRRRQQSIDPTGNPFLLLCAPASLRKSLTNLWFSSRLFAQPTEYAGLSKSLLLSPRSSEANVFICEVQLLNVWPKLYCFLDGWNRGDSWDLVLYMGGGGSMKNYMTSVHLVVAAATRAPQLNENKSSKYVQSDGTRFELNVDFSLSGGTRSIIVVHRIQTTTCWYSKETWSTGWERWDQIGFRSDLFFVIFVDIIFTCCSGSETEFAFFGCCSTLFLVTFGYLFLLLFWLTKKNMLLFWLWLRHQKW